MGHFLSFGSIGYMRETSQEHKLEPLGTKRVMPGIAQKETSSTFEVLNVRTYRNVVGHKCRGTRRHRRHLESAVTEL